MQALLIVDAQNEFSEKGLRAVPNHTQALACIRARVQQARQEGRPIAWVRHYNRPNESRAFVPGSWGSELSPGLGPKLQHGPEELFDKDVYGAFTGTGLEPWLHSVTATGVLVVGFYTHMCVSTTAREALIRGFQVDIDADATGARNLKSETVGDQTADEVRRSALLHLMNMGVRIVRMRETAPTSNALSAMR
jgi:nicotinamidase-related amidase